MIFSNAMATRITLCVALCVGASATENASLPASHALSPPSDEFCSSNALGDDTYISLFDPCEFIFYDSTVKLEHFSCGDLDEIASVVVKEQKRKVMLWPDSCVSVGPRCYDLSENPHLANFTIYENTEYAMEFPSGATVVSVDCSTDFEKVQAFTDNFPEEITKVARTITFAVALFFFSAVACLVAGICCCCGACSDRYGSRRESYQMVPSNKYYGPPVVATKYDAGSGPAYKAVV